MGMREGRRHIAAGCSSCVTTGTRRIWTQLCRTRTWQGAVSSKVWTYSRPGPTGPRYLLKVSLPRILRRAATAPSCAHATWWFGRTMRSMSTLLWRNFHTKPAHVLRFQCQTMSEEADATDDDHYDMPVVKRTFID